MKLYLGAITLMIVLAGAPVRAQGPAVRLDGQVQWIAGQKMMLILPGGRGVDVDIAQVPLDQYRTLTQSDWVIVYGAVSPDNRRVFASSITRDRRWSVESP